MSRRFNNHCGTALVMVLVLITVIVAPLLGFLLFMEFETRQAKKIAGSVESRMLSEFALQEALAKLMDGSTAASGAPGERKASMTAGPGLMEVLRYDVPFHRGTSKGAAAFSMPHSNRPFFTDPFAENYDGKPANPRWIPLYSRKWFAPGTRYLSVGPGAGGNGEENPDYNPAALFNLNTTDNPFRPGEFYLSGLPAEPAFPRREKDASGAFPTTGGEAAFAFRAGEPVCDRPVFVQWIPVLQDPTKPPGPENPMVGRYAYWIDVENTKVNLNRADRQWRKQPAFGLVGDADAIAMGSGSYFEQSSSNPAIAARRKLEGALPGPADRTLDGQTRRPTPTLIGASLRSLWLDWIDGNPPAVADSSVVDWDYLESVQALPNDEGVISFGDLAEANAAAVLKGKRGPLNQVGEFFSMIDPAMRESSRGHRAEAAFQRVVSPATTTHGYEDERDPLGQPKIDLVKFLRDNRNAAGSGGTPNMLKSTELWRRLANAKYHSVYDPGLVAAANRPRSFLQSLNRFAGTGHPSVNSNGEAAALQMLVNMIEYTLPHDQPPLIDTATGIVGMRSVPYVAEVVTRAKSALWLLPEADLNDLDKLMARDAAGNFTYSYNGKGLDYYATHVIVDLALAFVNPDPFADRIFDGTITLQYEWSRTPPGAILQPGPQTKPLKGLYAAIPEAAEEAKAIQVTGDAVVFNLGTIRAVDLKDGSYAQALRVKGWEIRDTAGNLWHKVPVKHFGATTVRDWWRMSQAGFQVSGAFDQYQKGETLGSTAPSIPAVGWFTIPQRKITALGRPLKNRLEMMGWSEGFPTTLTPAQLTRLQNFVGSLRWRAVFETVRCLDPALGHRTGHPSINSEFPLDKDVKWKGHVFGATGHPWRHVGSHGIEESEEDPEFASLRQTRATQTLQPAPEVGVQEEVLSVSAFQAKGVGLKRGSISVPVRQAIQTQKPQVEAVVAATEPEGLLRWFGSLNLDVFPLDRTDFKVKDDGKWMEELTQADGQLKPSKPGKDSDVETLEIAKTPEIKAFKTDELRGKQVKAFFCGAPRGNMMVSIGEIGFVHSGIPNFPILIAAAPGWNEYQLNCPKNGPPMRMLLDLFTPGAFVNPDTQRRVSEASWATAATPSNRPSAPRLGTWNVNSSIAHEGYMTIRQGATGTNEEMKKEFNPSGLTARVIWHPSAGGWRRNSYGNEHEYAKKLSESHRKFPGEPIDRLALPFTAMPRGAQAWVAAIGGDYSPSRAIGGGAWSYFNPGYNTFASGQFTWCAGRGVASSVPYYKSAFAEVGPDESLHSRLLTFGSDGRKAYELSEDGSGSPRLNENDGYLRGRFTADEWLDFQATDSYSAYLPRTISPRFSVFPMRHFVSDLGLDYNFGAELRLFKTALNPRTTAFPSVMDGDKIDDKLSDHNHFAGGHHASGLFLHAPHVLFANQLSASANAFTVHIVAQTIQDIGKPREGVANSGKGHSDPDDKVETEVWTRAIVTRDKPINDSDTEVRLRVISSDSR